MRLKRWWIVLVIVGAAFSAFADEKWYPYPVEVWDPPFNMESPRKQVDYVPLEKASKKWHIHVFFPHMKDAYWLAVNYGVASEAKRLGIRMTLNQAGGYTNLEIQIAQIKESLTSGSDGIIIGATSFDGLNDLVAEIQKKASLSSTSSTACPRPNCLPNPLSLSAKWASTLANTSPNAIPKTAAGEGGLVSWP